MNTDKFGDEVTLFDDSAKEHFGLLTNDEAIKSERMTDELPREAVAPAHKINDPADDHDNRRRVRRPRIL